MENRFNLIDEPWIPVADHGRASLRDIFSNPELRSLGGNPVEKIALLKLLLAIAQAAATPPDEHAWRSMGSDGLAQKCLAYLQHWHERFWLHGERPFLQLPAISAATQASYGALAPWVATGNTTVLNDGQVGSIPDDATRALLLLCQMAFPLGGKKTDNSVTLSPGYTGKKNDKGKPSSGRAGPAVGHMGLLHSFLVGESIQQTLWLNLVTTRQIEDSRKFPAGLGKAPWESMPEGENDQIARELRQSLMGRLIPLARFCLLTDEGVHYSEGIAHPDYKDGVVDPSVAADYSAKKPRVLWTNPDKRPWRELTALLEFFSSQDKRGMTCWQLEACMDRARDATETIGIWSGGLRVSSNAGEQYASGSDDFVASEVWLHAADLGSNWLAALKAEMGGLDTLAKRVYGCTIAFFKEQLVDGAKLAAQASSMFWQLCERDFQKLVDHCETTEEATEARRQLRYGFTRYALQAYDHYCPNDTARQLDAWASCRPNFNDYLKPEV